MAKLDLSDPEQWLPRELFAAYCGPGSDKLLAYYDKAKAKRKLITAQFDWLAFFVLPAWLGYRQQWALWGTLTGMVAAISVVEAIAHIQIPSGAFGGTFIALGLMANGLLLSNANGLYLKLKQQGLSPDAISTALAGRARPRVDLACAALVGSLVITVGTAWLLPS